jgi:putative transposase
VRSAIQQIAIEHRRRYGYRRISAELRRRSMRVNHKRVMRIMAETTCWRCGRSASW